MTVVGLPQQLLWLMWLEPQWISAWHFLHRTTALLLVRVCQLEHQYLMHRWVTVNLSIFHGNRLQNFSKNKIYNPKISSNISSNIVKFSRFLPLDNGHVAESLWKLGVTYLFNHPRLRTKKNTFFMLFIIITEVSFWISIGHRPRRRPDHFLHVHPEQSVPAARFHHGLGNVCPESRLILCIGMNRYIISLV